MRLEQIIRSTMTEAADMDGRLDQLVRAGLMPTSSLPLLKRAISRMHAGMSLQGAERDVMNMFISSMMFIVLGDDAIFNKARVGAKSYAAEETELDENAPIVAHLTKRYGDNIRKSHVMSAAKDFGVDASKLSKAVRKKLGKSMLDEAKEKTEYDYEGDMAMGQLKSIIANSQRMHDMLSDDTNLPEWVQSKITLAEDYISTASNYMQGEMNEEKMPFEGPYRKVGDRKDKYGNPIKNVAKHLAKKAMNAQKNEEVEVIDELSKKTMGSYVNKAAERIGTKGVSAGLRIAADEKSSGNFKDMGKRQKGIATAVKKLTKEDIEQVDEISKATLGSYVKKASGAEQPKNVMSPKNVPLTKIAAYQGDSETGHFGKRFNQHTYDKAERLRKNRETGIKRAVDKLTKEEVEITEASVADVAKTAHLHVRAGKHDSIHTAIQSAVNTHFPSSVHSSVTRKKVTAQALSRIQSMNKSKMTKEEVESIDEISSDMAHRYLKGKHERDYDTSADGKSSKLKKPQSFGKMNKDMINTARALRTIEKAKKTNEEVEGLDEISKKTMGRYINKAKDSIDMTSYRSGIKDGTAISSSTPYKSNNPLEKKLSKRHKGIETAVKKLTKEDIDAVKKMNESYKTAFQTALNEYGIKSPSELDESKRKEFFNHVDLEFKKGDN
jgi:hypothetical protein